MSNFQSMKHSIGLPIFSVNRQTDPRGYQNSDMNTLGQRIKARRKILKLTQKALASRVGMSQGNLSELENDEYPSSSFTAQLAHELKVSALWLSSGKGPMDVSDITTPPHSIDATLAEIVALLQDASDNTRQTALVMVQRLLTPTTQQVAEPASDYNATKILPFVKPDVSQPLDELMKCAQAMSVEGRYVLLGRAHEILNKYPAVKENHAS